MTADNEKLEKIIRDSGLRATGQRLQILSVLMNERAPQSAAAISKAIPNVDMVTVYRTLESFVESGVVRRVDVGHNHAHFEVAHMHRDTIQCRKCGKREEVDGCAIGRREALEVERSLKSFSNIEDHVVQFISICNTCK